jgi:hypothetical protein
MEGMAQGFGCMATWCVVAIPLAILGVWKLIELLMMLFSHVRWI